MGRTARWADLLLQGARAVASSHNYLVFFVTARCNARCPFCFYWEEIEHAHSRNELTLDEIRRFTEKSGHILYLSVGGGEPFLRKELAEICGLFYRKTGMRFLNITTNGLQPKRTEEVVRRILEENPHLVLKINLSLEAWGPRHDEIRGVPGNFEKVRETYRVLDGLRNSVRHFAINCATTYSRMNESEVVPLIDAVAREWKVNDHTVTFIRGEVKDASAKDPAVEGYASVVRHLEAVRNEKIPLIYRALRGVARTMFWMNLEVLRHDRWVVPCTAGRRMLTLSDDGMVKPCEILSDKEGTDAYDFGNLRDADFDLARLCGSEKARAAVSWIRSSKCRCTFECANMCNIAVNPVLWPRVAREMLRT